MYKEQTTLQDVFLPEMAKDAFDGVSYLASELTLAPVKAPHCVKSDQPVVLYLRVFKRKYTLEYKK